MQERHYRISSGEGLEIITKWQAEREAGFAQVNEIGVRYNGVMDKHVMFGTRVEGIKFLETPDPKLWRPIAKTPGYYRPNKMTKAGREIFKALDAIRYPSDQDLAVRLGCRPFFPHFGAYYCTNLGYKKVGEDYYVELPLLAPMKVMPGSELITRVEYFTAIDGPV